MSTLRNNLLVSINGVGTAHFNPLPAVAMFLTDKERRNTNPHVESYKKRRKFVKHFFYPETVVEKSDEGK